ncbi:MarR family winged helix-turn-helix transcriptional regulator [Sciscionella sediminilitoris]|uniref:MarR family winged helix-turn-helix transcriptional regulator n=1 Tax=Sciscionella sediminilitoris TaxID=1445613 RepID=UPI0004DF96EE|nr:MarR family transcriptional regulator [Sciscionella sp. SE31]
MTNPADDDTDIDAVTDAMLTASRLLIAISARSIASVADSLTLPQFRLLVVLANGGATKLVTLAEQLGVNPSTATRTVDRLISSGMVTREANPASRREILLRLSPEGERVVERVTSQRRAEIAEIVARMPAAERAGFVEALWSFARAGGEPPAGNRVGL